MTSPSDARSGTIVLPRQLLARWRSRAQELRRFAPPAAEAFDLAAEEAEEAGVQAEAPPAPAPGEPAELTWRERLWTAPAQTRIGRDELLEALGKSRSWLYALTGVGKIPHRKSTEGELVFVVGEIRAWLREREVVIVPGTLAREDARRQDSGPGR